jgi:hypothetical protein
MDLPGIRNNNIPFSERIPFTVDEYKAFPLHAKLDLRIVVPVGGLAGAVEPPVNMQKWNAGHYNFAVMILFISCFHKASLQDSVSFNQYITYKTGVTDNIIAIYHSQNDYATGWFYGLDSPTLRRRGNALPVSHLSAKKQAKYFVM